MAKINLLTIHYGRCYGAVMQTYATCKILESMGHQVTVINLINPSRRNAFTTVKSLLNLVTEFKFWMFKHTFFSQLTNKAYNVNNITMPAADVYIVGSDQVWNKNITKCMGDVFFLNFIKNKKKLAFCSSFGKELWSEDELYTTRISGLLDDFHAISLREESGLKILRDIFNLDGVRLMDPTLEWGNFKRFISKSVKDKRQIFPFLLGSNNLSLLTLISETYHLPLYKMNRYRSVFDRGPKDWLNNIYHSEFIVTDSFHGLAFCILFQKQFIVCCADSQKFTRLLSLLKLLNLEDRYVKSKDDFLKKKDLLYSKIDYASINKVLEKEREKCREFLCNNI